MDKEMESSLQQMMARFLAEMKVSYAEIEARAEAHQEKLCQKWKPWQRPVMRDSWRF
jgi:hypothetical protein